LTVGGLSTFTASRCSDAIVKTAATDKYSNTNRAKSITITAPSACAGLPYALTAYRSNGKVLVTLSGWLEATGSTKALVSDGYKIASVKGVALTIGTWGVPTYWIG